MSHSASEPPAVPPASIAPADPPAAALARAHRILLETARQLGGSLEPGAIFTRLRESVAGAMPCDGLIVSSFDRAGGLIRCAYAWVGGNLLDPGTLPPLTYRPEEGGMQSEVIRTGRPRRFSDVAERVRDPAGTYYEVEPSGAVRDLKQGGPPASRSALMVPLRLEDEVVGVVQVMADAEAAYTEDDLELLEGISLLLAVALENARLYRRARDEVEERRRAERVLREAEEALREADRRKDEFLALLGHELRNPLGVISFAAELLRRGASDDPLVRRYEAMISHQVRHLVRLTDDLLVVARITQGKVVLDRRVVDLGEVLGEAVEALRPLIESLGQRVRVHGAAKAAVLGDPVRLAQVFTNLLDNAAKYGRPGGEIDVAVERRGQRVAVVVRDQGVGIAAEELPRVFDLFYQSQRQPPGGLGVGLTLVRTLIELHDGTVRASSAGPGQGSEFVVELPLVEADPVREEARPEVAVARPLRILVADDVRDSSDSMALLLRMSGHEVEVAYDGAQALETAERYRPDALLLDIGMPGLDGYQVAERVRRLPWGREAVLVAATGWGQDEDRRRSHAAGFDAHLVKPVDLGALLRLLEERVPQRAAP